MRGFAVIVALCVAVPAFAQSDDTWTKIQKHDQGVRARNSSTDFFFVSTNSNGLQQKRFYIDRNTIVGSQGRAAIAHGWVDMYDVVEDTGAPRLRHTKMLMEATCSGDPKLHFRVIVTFGPDGSAKSSDGENPWRDVVPGTSTETLHRFLCDDQPANAYYPVSVNGNTPEKDAMSYFAKQK